MIEKWNKLSPETMAAMEASSELVRLVNASSLEALQERVNELLPTDTPFESLKFRGNIRSINGLELTNKHVLAICIRILEKHHGGTPMTNEDVAKFIGFSVLGDPAQRKIINMLPIEVAQHATKAPRSNASLKRRPKG
jgi:hypothetical protein